MEVMVGEKQDENQDKMEFETEREASNDEEVV